MAQREGSRTPHEGTIEFISLDSHRGAGESLSDTATGEQASLFLTQASQACHRAISVALLSGAGIC